MSDGSRLLRIEAPHLCAGVVVDAAGIVRETAPILSWARGWTGRRLRAYAAGRGWCAAYVGEPARAVV